MLAFLLVATVLIVVPGQDTALTIRNTIAGGRAGGLATAGGITSAQAVWTAATAAGLAALLVASRPAFDAVRIVGVAYLLVLGVRMLRDALRRTRGAADAVRGAARTPRRAYRQGLLSNLSNPKMGVFFTSLLPQFAGSFSGVLALGALFAGMTLAWLAAYAAVVARIGDAILRPRVRRAIDAVTGLVLLAFGARLATERR
jgi:threonine/homoserine/homoserine lactone efflux protein